MNEAREVFQVYTHQHKAVATIVLNGHDIAGGGPFGQHGAMRSFKVIQGDLWEPWDTQTSLLLRNKAGLERLVKVAALPVEEDSSGLIEFL